MKITRLEVAQFTLGVALVCLDLALVAGVALRPDFDAPEWLRGYGSAYFVAGFLVSALRPGAYLVAGAGVFVTALLVAVVWPQSWCAESWTLPPLLLGGAALSGEIFGAAIGSLFRRARKDAV